MTCLLALSGVGFRYADRPILASVDLSIAPGDHLCLLGENGAGKSTLLKICAGILRPAVGQVTLSGRRIDGLRRLEIARQVSYLPQDSTQVFPFTALEVVLMGRYARTSHAFETGADLCAAEEAMVRTDCWHLRARPFTQLSGGERRRVMLAQALAQKAQLLLLDEPTAGLDLRHALALCQTMLAISQEGRALLWSTHDLNLAARFAPRAALLSQGRLLACGPTDAVLLQAGTCAGVPLHLGTLPSGRPFVVPA